MKMMAVAIHTKCRVTRFALLIAFSWLGAPSMAFPLALSS
jgi:hypothetical protein